MIIDSLTDATKYFSLHPFFEKAFAYINSSALSIIPAGKYIVDGENIKAIFFTQPGVSEEKSIDEFECHNQHIDIQVCIRGKEKFGWKPRASCVKPKGAYDTEKDVLIFEDKPDMFFELHAGQFVILFPEDVHAPMIAVDDLPIQKMVLKVRV
ncbi:YhcH/YjgK/YiaL family protein [Ferruginibacter paludis]|uniref:YhcH/YjgK/YiaL family protein n=1 Tax=Ferruginibacter paludis TaxID=1310417 RepID=UPI0025B4D462|nr:YhcH/YjgK/YiaL family protein [Ferruginibacter paludis]MDN3654811.1 YhcH/YjgK/YiaL family protein [Ferruginibacter paludis]